MATACSLGAKESQGNAILRSVARLRSSGTVAGTATWAFGIKQIPPGAISDPQAFFRRAAPVTMPFAVDLDHDRAQIGPVAKPAAVYSGHVVFVRRSGASSGLTSRTWSRLSYVDHRDDHGPGVQSVADNIGAPTAALLPPMHVLELLAGTLKGSVKRLGTATVAGVTVSHYKANVSVDSANRKLHLSERDLDARHAAFTAVAQKGDVLPAEIWVDGNGVLRKIRLRFTQKPARSATLFFDAEFEITALRQDAPAAAPSRRDYVRVDSPTELVRGLHDAPTA